MLLDYESKEINFPLKTRFTHQNPVKSGGRPSSLHVPEYGDARVLLQVVYHDFLHQLGGNRLAFAVDRSLGYDDNVQTLTWFPFLVTTIFITNHDNND